jgi:threonyl-tRNA synthetase
MHNDRDIMMLRHSAAHLLAHAVSELFPSTLLTIGPATKEGFFYDFLPVHNFKESDLAAISEKMTELANQNLPLTHEPIARAVARELYKNNPFKLELIDNIEGDTVGLARQGSFYDLCKGGHVASTGQLHHFLLTNIAGSYWRADKNNQVLQRITGIIFFTKEEKESYLRHKEEVALYDHRRLGKDLDLFSFHAEGTGFPFFHPHGMIVLKQLKNHLYTLLSKYEYQDISTPIMLNQSLWIQSGHYEHYKNNMYFCNVDQQEYAIKPMNCPGSILIFKERLRSYRDLPLRFSESGLVHRHELSGVLHGLFRVRAFTQDDGHIYCAPDDIGQEVANCIAMTYDLLKPFDFPITVALSTKPKNAMGDEVLWDQSIQALRDALDHSGKPYTIQEGEGAFYGPKIEFHLKDSMERSWQCGTIQLDFFQPQNFDLGFVSAAGIKQRPVMIHRAIYGSFERFFGILLEHYKGHLPLWLAPVQIKILTITDQQAPHALHVHRTLTMHNIRASISKTSDPIRGQIKAAALEKIPLLAIIGNKEVENNTVTLRSLSGEQEYGLSVQDVISTIQSRQPHY